MSSVLYLFKELVFSLEPRGIRVSLIAVGLMALFLCVLTSLLLAWDLLDMSRDINFYAIFKEKLSQEAIGRLSTLIRDWPEVLQDPIYFDGCETAQNCKLPEELHYTVRPEETAAGFFKVIARGPQDIASLEGKLNRLEVFSKVVTYDKSSLRQSLARSALGQNLAVVILGLCLIAVVIAISLTSRTLERDWAPELETLYLSGVHATTLRMPFFFMGIVYGIVSALVTLLIFYLLQLWGVGADGAIRRWLPDVLQSDFLAQLTWRLLGLGLLLGALIGGLTALGARLKLS